MHTEQEILESDLRVAIIKELIKARNEYGITQRELEELSGVKQPIIARLEKGTTNPTLGTVIKVLAAMGQKLEVVPMDKVSSNKA